MWESSFPPADNANFAVFADSLREWREIHYTHVVPASILDLVWLSLIVVNRVNFTVLAQGLGELCEICSARGQLLLFGCFCNRLTKKNSEFKSE